MVQESVRLYGFTREELLEWVYLCEESPSGLRWSKVFACKKFGHEKARNLAIQYRLGKDLENNVQTRGRTLNDT